MIVTGLRGVGKTVLLESFRPVAIQERWGWVGTDLSEASSISEDTMAIRVITDLSVLTSAVSVNVQPSQPSLIQKPLVETPLTYGYLSSVFHQTPGLTSDKLKGVLELAWRVLSHYGVQGVVFAYDEAQNLSDNSDKAEYPLSLLLDVFQSIQRKGVKFLLVLTGLPTLFPKLVASRTYSERMFHQLMLGPLSVEDSTQAIVKPLHDSMAAIHFDKASVATIVELTGGYPEQPPAVPVDALMRKLDTDFFAGRWARVTDRQRDLLTVAASLPNCDTEFTVQELTAASKARLASPFTASHINQMLVSLSSLGIVYRNRHGKYVFAVPLFGQFIRRQVQDLPLVNS
jgi:type II secretory pathway predicted ATPase ExeA